MLEAPLLPELGGFTISEYSPLRSDAEKRPEFVELSGLIFPLSYHSVPLFIRKVA